MRIDDLYKRAMKYSKKGDYQKAILEFDKIIVKDPSNAEVLSDRAVAKMHLNDLEGALDDMDQALELEPENPYRYASRAYVRDRSGDTKGAIEDYRKAIELDPENAVSHNNLGLLEEKLGYMEMARKRYQTADKLGVHIEEEILSIQKRDQMVDQLLKDLEIPVDTDDGPQRSLIAQMLSVFTSKDERRDFLNYIRNFFK